MQSRSFLTSKLRTALLAWLGASAAGTAGCIVYDDEMLRRPDDAGLGGHDDVRGVDDRGPALPPPPSSDATSEPVARPDVNVADVAADASGTGEDARPDSGTARDVIGADEGGTTFDAEPRTDAPSDATSTDAGVPPNDAPFVDRNDVGGGADLDSSIAIDVQPEASLDVHLDEPEVDAGTPPPTFRVLRVGDGTSPLTTASSRGFLEERTFDGALVGSPIALPTTTSGAQFAATFAGSAAAEGSLSLSADGRFITMAAYASPAGVDAIPSSTVPRVVVRVDATGTVDSSTKTSDAFRGGSVRGATSLDGTAFWLSGNGGSSSTAGGIWHVPFGGGTSTLIVPDPSNVRWLHVIAGQLYASAGTKPTTNVFIVGSGTPTTGAQGVTSLAGMPTSDKSPYGFALFDRDPAVPGVDTLYLADDESPALDGSAGGIQKWTSDGATWTRVATFSELSGSARASFRGLAAIDNGSNVTLVASTAETDPNRLVVYVDDGGANVVGQVIATSASASVFRGIALSPHP